MSSGLDGRTFQGIRSVALGECDPAQGYTGRLSNPPGITVEGDEGCGFAYGDIWWDTSSYEQQSAILNLDHPLGGDAELHLDVNLTQSDSAFRYAPSGRCVFLHPGQQPANGDQQGSDSGRLEFSSRR